MSKFVQKNIAYPNTHGYHEHTAGFDYFPTYTTDIHAKITPYETFKRSDILKAMISKESSSQHWNSVTPYRMVVGSGDELGSKGFNQIQNAYTYGARSSQGHLADPRCHQVSAYTTKGKSAVNHYDPEINAMAMAVFSAGERGDCGRGFYLAFANHPENAPGDEKNSGASYIATHNLTGTTLKRLKTGTVYDAVTGSYKDDAYDLLKKAVGAYNQGQGTFNKTTSWSELLLTKKSSASKDTVVTAMHYAIDILQGDGPSVDFPPRQYIWLGGQYAADLTDEAGLPDPKAGTDWCFAYGEVEWLAGKKWTKVKEKASPTDPAGNMKTTTGLLDCT